MRKKRHERHAASCRFAQALYFISKEQMKYITAVKASEVNQAF
jgi:hypothetical protein